MKFSVNSWMQVFKDFRKCLIKLCTLIILNDSRLPYQFGMMKMLHTLFALCLMFMVSCGCIVRNILTVFRCFISRSVAMRKDVVKLYILCTVQHASTCTQDNHYRFPVHLSVSLEFQLVVSVL